MQSHAASKMTEQEIVDRNQIEKKLSDRTKQSLLVAIILK